MSKFEKNKSQYIHWIVVEIDFADAKEICELIDMIRNLIKTKRNIQCIADDKQNKQFVFVTKFSMCIRWKWSNEMIENVIFISNERMKSQNQFINIFTFIVYFINETKNDKTSRYCMTDDRIWSINKFVIDNINAIYNNDVIKNRMTFIQHEIVFNISNFANIWFSCFLIIVWSLFISLSVKENAPTHR